MIIEITKFQLKDGVTEDIFNQASLEFNKNYCSRCEGLVRRHLVKTDNGYMDIFLWKSREHVEKVQETFMQDEDAMKFASMIDTVGFEMKNYEAVGIYNFNN
ncbi:hypothetical protein [Flagellimonas nanhaiensis]|nr:hypothetical protein [Allomuricauda nanhaiensis]